MVNWLVELTWANVLDYGAAGDGTTDDSTAIQDAVDALSTIGGRLYFPKGLYRIGSTISVNKPITIEGAGLDVVTLKPLSNVTVFDITGTSQVRVMGIAIDGDYPTRTSGNAVTISNTTDVRVYTCRFFNVPGTAIDLSKVERIWVENCTFETIGLSGVRLSTPGAGNANRNVWITNNAFRDVNKNAQAGHAAAQSHGTSGIIQDRIWVCDNDIETSGTVGIGLDLLTNGVVARNRVRDCGGEGIAFSGADIHATGNRVDDCAAAGILLWTMTYTGNQHVQIDHNGCWNCGQGIAVVWGDSNVAIDDVRITHNRCYDGGSNAQDYGIQSYLASGVTTGTWTNVVIAYNNLMGNVLAPYNLVNGDTAMVQFNIVENSEASPSIEMAPSRYALSGVQGVGGLSGTLSTELGFHYRHLDQSSIDQESSVLIVAGFSGVVTDKIGGLEVVKWGGFANKVASFVLAHNSQALGVERIAGAVPSGTNTNWEILGGAWDSPHLVLGNYHLWVDGNDRLRIKNGIPSSATDGTVVGTQS